MPLPILHAKNIYKSYAYPINTPILNGIDLTIYPGDSVAIMGRSGEGKSTLLHILGTLETACQGTLEIAGNDTSSFSKTQVRNRHISFVFQSFHLLNDCTALENVLMPAKIARQNVSKGSIFFKKGIELLEQVKLSHRAHYNVKLLSGGEKQRVAIARAFCNNPDIILADEPSGNLDSHNAQIIQELLIQFVNQMQKALIVVTHDHHLASLCRKQYQLQEGKLYLT
ncbi:MAG TPA: ABC transporter ATP-binding protein [Waddliaceae bacterium]